MLVNDDRARTLEAIRVRGWEVVRLRGKKPVGPHWITTTDPAEAGRWLDAGSNLGLICHERTGVAVLDPDRLDLWADMIACLGQPALPWVLTGSARLHYYVRWEADLPAKLCWCGTGIGEIQRGPGQQQIVLPPSHHPETGRPYQWITDSLGGLVEPIDPVRDPLPHLPGEWLAYLRAHVYR